MPEFRFAPEDLSRARDLLSQQSTSAPDEPTAELAASAINVERRSHVDGDVTDDELRVAHDYLCGPAMRHRGGIYTVLESLASAMLARGLVPDTDAYGGEWWLWWPKKGRGPCAHCGKERALTRYMSRQVLPERYLCQRCRKEELAELEEYLNEVTGVTREPGESAESLYLKRMAAIARQAAIAARPSRRPGEPCDETWSRYAADLAQLLGSLAWAGWGLPESYDTDYDAQDGAYLFGELFRTGMVIEVLYEPGKGELLMLPCEDEDFSRLSMLTDAVTISVGHDIDRGAELVAEQAGELGLLDATHLVAAPDSDVSTAELIIKVLMDFLARDVLPDAVPDAAALGVAAWCWRNDTDVEDWHLPSDVLMAKVNLAVTKAVLPHVDPVEGVDWQGIEDNLTDPSWQLAGGRVVSDLFAEGWPDVERTVRRQVRMWRRLDEDLIGPDATIRLLTIAGSTSYTRHWWGQGRWPAICRAIVTDAINSGVGLPPPYGTKGIDALLSDLQEPDSLSDDALAWMIDIPGTDIDGPRGLRSHPSTRPIAREFSLYLLDTEEVDTEEVKEQE